MPGALQPTREPGRDRTGPTHPEVAAGHLFRHDRMLLFLRAWSSSRREPMSSLANTLPRCHSTVRRPMNSCAPISELVRPSQASWAISSSCGVRSTRVSSLRLRTVSPVAWSSRRARSAKASAPIDASASNADRSWSRASIRRFSRRSHSP